MSAIEVGMEAVAAAVAAAVGVVMAVLRFGLAPLWARQIAPISRNLTGRSHRCKEEPRRRDNRRVSASILVAEDQTDIRELLVMNLRAAGYEVEAVADGPAALASQKERASDLLVLDLMMPGLDGLEVCK